MVTGPSFDATKVAILDGTNIALTRGQVGGRAVHEDLVACISYFSNQQIRTLTFLDDDATGEELRYLLRARYHHKGAWLCRPADTVILETAAVVQTAFVVSRDDFAEYQDRHPLVLFARDRFFAFEPGETVGSGRIRSRSVVAKYSLRATSIDDVLLNFATVLDALLSVSAADAAETFRHSVESKVAADASVRAQMAPLLDFARVLISLCRGASLGWKRLLIRRDLRNKLKAVVGDDQPVFVRRNCTLLPDLVRHLGSGGAFSSQRGEAFMKEVLATTLKGSMGESSSTTRGDRACL